MAKRSLRIRMDIPFALFTKERKQDFLRDFSIVSGCPKKDLENASFSEGCTNFSVDLDSEAVNRFVDYFNRREANDGDIPQDLKDFIAFLEKWKATAVYPYASVTVTAKDFDDNKAGNERQILFVHGWRGNADSFGELPEYLAEHFDCDSQIYEYPTGIWAESPSLEFIARHLDNWVRNHLHAKRVGIVAHSMGGIIVRRFITSQRGRDTPIDATIRQITFVASPRNGAVLAGIGTKVPALRKIQLRELAGDSSFIFALNEEWPRWMRENVPQHCAVRCIVGLKDRVVSPNNARGDDPEAVPIPGAGHIDIVKPKSEKDEVVLTIKRFFNESTFA